MSKAYAVILLSGPVAFGIGLLVQHGPNIKHLHWPHWHSQAQQVQVYNGDHWYPEAQDVSAIQVQAAHQAAAIQVQAAHQAAAIQVYAIHQATQARVEALIRQTQEPEAKLEAKRVFDELDRIVDRELKRVPKAEEFIP